MVYHGKVDIKFLNFFFFWKVPKIFVNMVKIMWILHYLGKTSLEKILGTETDEWLEKKIFLD